VVENPVGDNGGFSPSSILLIKKNSKGNAQKAKEGQPNNQMGDKWEKKNWGGPSKETRAGTKTCRGEGGCQQKAQPCGARNTKSLKKREHRGRGEVKQEITCR